MNEQSEHWFEQIASHLQGAYLRYSFTKGTVKEIDFIVANLRLDATTRVLDVGCGPGRHSLELARRGIPVHGIDISSDFIEIARESASRADLEPLASFQRLDARFLGRSELQSSFDAVICLCQGAFGLMTADGDDELVLEGIRACLRDGGRLVLSAFNAYFAVKYHEAADFDARSGVSHEVTEIRSPGGEVKNVDLWTGCYTPRELRLLMERAGLRVDRLLSVDPGGYADRPPTVESSEFLVLATAS